ncbi:hypothetical protein [Ammoniphilus sp. CFH 90114]|nr:hypothetical protein [Ammoniphilus sp. CFH 90114]
MKEAPVLDGISRILENTHESASFSHEEDVISHFTVTIPIN